MNIQEPIIIIGAGRSGSTLLTRIFNAHPKIDFKGETDFLLPRLWLEIWTNRFWLNWERQVSMNPKSALTPLPKLSETELQVGRSRVGKLVADLLVNLLRVDTGEARVWGYKEPWNGSSSFRYAWESYDAVLPGARWVHLVRNPFTFARSSAQWDGQPWTLPYLKARLGDWQMMVKYNRLRSHTGRYWELRFEDVLADTRAALEPVLEHAGVEWHPDCARAAQNKVMQSHEHRDEMRTRQLRAKEIEAIVDEIEGVRGLMTELGYTTPETMELLSEDAGPLTYGGASVDLRNLEGEVSDECLPRYHLEQTLQGLRQKLQKEQAESGQSQRQLAEYQRQLQESQHQLGKSQLRVAECQRQLQDSQHQLGESQLRVAECQRQLQDSQHQLGESGLRLTECQKQLEESQDQLRESRLRVAEHQKQLEESQRKLRESQLRVAEYQEWESSIRRRRSLSLLMRLWGVLPSPAS